MGLCVKNFFIKIIVSDYLLAQHQTGYFSQTITPALITPLILTDLPETPVEGYS
jgi:hypothetical protein